jgi:hypothetical protein
MKSVCGSAGNALRLRRQRRRDNREEYASQYCTPFHHFSFCALKARGFAANEGDRVADSR